MGIKISVPNPLNIFKRGIVIKNVPLEPMQFTTNLFSITPHRENSVAVGRFFDNVGIKTTQINEFFQKNRTKLEHLGINVADLSNRKIEFFGQVKRGGEKFYSIRVLGEAGKNSSLFEDYVWKKALTIRPKTFTHSKGQTRKHIAEIERSLGPVRKEASSTLLENIFSRLKALLIKEKASAQFEITNPYVLAALLNNKYLRSNFEINVTIRPDKSKNPKTEDGYSQLEYLLLNPKIKNEWYLQDRMTSLRLMQMENSNGKPTSSVNDFHSVKNSPEFQRDKARFRKLSFAGFLFDGTTNGNEAFEKRIENRMRIIVDNICHLYGKFLEYDDWDKVENAKSEFGIGSFIIRLTPRGK